MSSSRVTVLLPVYNGEKYLAQAIESILAQSYRDFELLIINDGSTDQSGEIIEKYRAQDPRIRHVQQENQGLIKTLNRGLSLAHSEYFARQDADDLSLPERLKKQVEFLDQNPGHALVGTTFLLRKSNAPDQPMPLPLAHEQIVEGFLLGNRFAHGSVMFRRKEFLEVGAYSDRPQALHIEDFDAWVRLAQAHLVANLPEPLYIYRDHAESISNQKRAVQDSHRDQLIEKLKTSESFLKFRHVQGYRLLNLAYQCPNDPLKYQRIDDTRRILIECAGQMMKLGRKNDALARWISAALIDPKGFARKLLKRFSAD